MPEDKLHCIEEELAHQEQKIIDLSDMVTCQWEEINALKKCLAKMQGKINMLEDSPEGEELSIADQAARDKPPHY